MKRTIVIKEYDPAFQAEIDRMMERIQHEFQEAITTKHSTVIKEVYKLPLQKYWVAFCQNQIAGTIGMVLYSNNSAVIKRMMVDKEYRGSKFYTAKMLLDEAVDWAKEQGSKTIYLGTMNQFIAAQKFYEKSGFQKTTTDKLPVDYKMNPMDSVYYLKEI